MIYDQPTKSTRWNFDNRHYTFVQMHGFCKSLINKTFVPETVYLFWLIQQLWDYDLYMAEHAP